MFWLVKYINENDDDNEDFGSAIVETSSQRVSEAMQQVKKFSLTPILARPATPSEIEEFHKL